MAGTDTQTAEAARADGADPQSHGAAHADLTEFLIGLARGGAGALIFAVPMLMTMEMWELGFYIGRGKLLMLLLVNIPLLVLVARRLGFERNVTWRQAVRDAFVAYAIGIVTSATFLTLFGLIRSDMPAFEIVGKIAIQSVPAGIGAILGRSQLGGSSVADDDEKDAKADTNSGEDPQSETGYATEMFLMAVGALFLSLNVAPTEEMILVAYKMTYWHALVMILVSIALMHGFVYAVSFQGGHELSEDTPWWHAFIRFTVPGYVVALAISTYTLWTFERLNDASPLTIAMSVIVLGLPSAIGAASARLVL